MRQMQSCHDGTETGRHNEGIRLEFSFVAKSMLANGDGRAPQRLTGVPAGKGMASESARPPWGHKAVANGT